MVILQNVPPEFWGYAEVSVSFVCCILFFLSGESCLGVLLGKCSNWVQFCIFDVVD